MIVWLDLETTGLDPDEDRILELGMIVTFDDLSEVARKSWVLACSPLDLSSMEPEVVDMHSASGLFSEVCRSTLSHRGVETAALEWLTECGVLKGLEQLGGNNVGFDRSFLLRWMPVLLKHFHYRSLDMSSVNEFARRWTWDAHEDRPQGGAHRALADLDVSIALAEHYRGEWGT